MNRLRELEQLDETDLAQIIKNKDEDGRSLLHASAGSGNEDLVSFLLAHGAEDLVNSADDEGWTPIHSAVSAGHEGTAELLLKAGADPNAANNGGRTPLHYANLSCERHLNNADKDQLRAALAQASKGRLSLLKLLIQSGANSKAKDLTGSTLLHRACSAGKVEVVKYLVESKAVSLENKDRYGASPLSVAAASGEKDVALYLIDQGADVESENKEGDTPLSLAATHKGLREAMVTLARQKHPK